MRGFQRLLGAITAVLLSACAASASFAQVAVQQSGPVIPFHPAAWYSNGVVGDGGNTTTPFISSLGMFNGANCPFGISSQTGPGATSAPYSQFSVCQTDTTTTLNVLGIGQATPNLVFNIGGTLVPFPGPGGGTVVSVGLSGGSTGLTSSGGPITGLGTLTLGGTLNVASGGTGCTTSGCALNTLLPTQTGQSGKVLTTNGSTPAWQAVSGTGTVTSVNVTGGSTGLTTSGGPVTASGAIALGGVLNVASGGTGTASPGLVAGSNVTVTGSWPNQTIATAGGGVTSVATGTDLTGGPITSTGTIGLGGNVPRLANNQTFTGQQNFTQPVTVSAGTSSSSQSWLRLLPTDFGASVAEFAVAPNGPNAYKMEMFNSTTNAVGTLDFQVGSLTFNGSPLLTAAGTGFATLAGTQTFTGTNTFSAFTKLSAGTSTCNCGFLGLSPSDYGTGKPALNFNKDASATSYTIGLFDGTSDTGTLRLSASSVVIPGSLAVSGGSTVNGSAICTQSTGCGGASSGYGTVFDVVATYGGDPTGSADNTTAFNNALAACNGTGGGILWFQGGTYKFTSAINDNVAGCSIQGAGPTATKFQPTGISGDFLTVPNTGVTPTTFSNFQIHNGGSWTSGYAINTSASWPAFHDIYLLDSPQGVHVSGGAESRFDRMLIYDQSSSPIVLCDNATSSVFGTRWDQITIGYSGSNTTATLMEFGGGCNSVTLNAVGGVQGASCIQTFSSFTFLFANDLECDFNNVLINGGEALHFVNSYFQGGNGYNINFGGGFTGGATITGSRIFGASTGGILINGGTDVTVTGNNIGANGTYGINVGSGITDFTLTGNRIGNIEGMSGQTNCIVVNSGSSNGYIIANNNCRGNTNAVVDGGSGSTKSVTGNIGP